MEGREEPTRARRRLRRIAPGRRGAIVIGCIAAGDLAYRLLAREPLRRALGIEPRPV